MMTAVGRVTCRLAARLKTTAARATLHLTLHHRKTRETTAVPFVTPHLVVHPSVIPRPVVDRHKRLAVKMIVVAQGTPQPMGPLAMLTVAMLVPTLAPVFQSMVQMRLARVNQTAHQPPLRRPMVPTRGMGRPGLVLQMDRHAPTVPALRRTAVSASPVGVDLWALGALAPRLAPRETTEGRATAVDGVDGESSARWAWAEQPDCYILGHRATAER